MSKSEASATIRPFPKPAERNTQPEPSDAAQPREVPAVEPAQAPAPAPTQPPEQQPNPAASEETSKPKRGLVKRILLPVLGVSALAAGGWYGYDYYTTGRFTISTDDAYIGADIATIAPKVSGYVAAVNTVANQRVKAGDALVTLDNGDYRIARDQAKAQIASQEMTLKRIEAQVEGARSAVTQAQAQKSSTEAVQRNAATAQQRAQELVAKRVGSQSTLDQANAALEQANASLIAADAQITAAKANVDVIIAQRNEAASAMQSLQLALEKAERDLGFTVLRAPYDGIIGNVAVQKGNLVSVGSRLLAIVPAGALYIDANFKETQLARIEPGETATVKVDALGGDKLTGKVASVAPASGSVFSLLPAENATGNFTKVVQRVPVRIALPAEAQASSKLRAGLSVVVSIDSRTAPAKP